MDRYVRDMVRAALQPEDLHVEHVREPRYRKPVGRLRGRERPPDALRRDSAPHVQLLVT